MKNLYISLAIVIGVIIFVIFSSIIVSISIRDIEDKISAQVRFPEKDDDFEIVINEIDALRNEFSKREILLSLLIPDRTLEELKNCFADVINYAKAKSTDGVLTSVERLHNALENIRIKAEFTPKSIF